jgi:hypothetical protein
MKLDAGVSGVPRRRTRKRWMILMVLDDKRKREIEERYGKSIDDMDDDELDEAKKATEGK